jgi:NAD(P)-dependent dehydrogenase (short-subunit alcohol dehydrogenase family)
MELLRPGVLAGVRIVVAAPDGGAGGGELGRAVAARAAALGASVAGLAVDPEGSEADAEAAAARLPAGTAVLVWDGDATTIRTPARTPGRSSSIRPAG